MTTVGGRVGAAPQTALELLRLLAEDAPAELLEQQAAQVEAANPGAGAAARPLALRVRAVLDARRRREAELSALVDTARELASMRDPGHVLEAIVRRARTLLGTDVAHLTLHDKARGDTYMRATDGAVSPVFKSVRLPLGTGLGGLVAQTRRPYWTTDYFADLRFQHAEKLDNAVADEGLVAICGVPLLVDEEFVGVLMASNRSPRPFTHEEVSLLGSLAALAAVSIVQARAAAETQEALSALSVAYETVRRQATAAERAATAHDQFAQIVLSGGGVDDIASALAELLGGWVVVLDARGRRTAAHGEGPPPETGGTDPLATSAAVRASDSSGRLAASGGIWAAAVAAAGDRMGTLVLGGRQPLDANDQRTVERAAVVTALLLLFRQQASESELRVRTDLLADLLSPDASTAHVTTLPARARLLGIDLSEPHVLAVCQPAPGQSRRSVVVAAAELLEELTAPGRGRPGHPGLVGEHAGDVVVLVPGGDPSTVATRLAERLSGAGTPVTVGAAGPVVPENGLREAYPEAVRTSQALISLGTPGRGACATDLGFAGLVVGGTPDVGRYVTSVLGPLLDYDARRRSDLLGTVEAYFAAGMSPSRAAGALHVHVNTVAQRLERVAHVLGPDWAAPGRAMEVQLALRLHRLNGTAPRDR
ncbi:GAF domain-containing protein [Cellulomonas fimi]|uniref:helix-turn-helix domain-containing protein n=1 Tax=Cellulomonas fimi TaxID=1708 RepID=UPI001B881C03|nr:GAF domain-containing protein [Cellulomonas fimi]